MSWITRKINEYADQILKHVTKEIREEFVKFLDQLEAKADKTPNPVDNWIIDILRDAFNIKKGASNGKGQGNTKKRSKKS